MGGESKQTTTQQSQTQPWEAAQPAIKGILDQLNTLVPNSGLSQTSQNAISQLQQNAQAGNPYASQIGSLATNLLNGGGATDQSGNVNQAYQDYLKATQPLASNTNYDPYSTPGFADAIRTASADITNGVNSQFAAAGRDFSGASSQALSRGRGICTLPAIRLPACSLACSSRAFKIRCRVCRRRTTRSPRKTTRRRRCCSSSR